jgi:protocatechuate 3,4-dioxygenase beta subunit
MPFSDVKGEEVRKDITNGEKGIPLTLAIQVVDYKTCQTVPQAHVDIWSSNSTVSIPDLFRVLVFLFATCLPETNNTQGIYVGVQGYPGMGDPNDASILKGTTLRGVQPTDDHGVASFDSLFPGHYDGRATHIHGELSSELPPNSTP